MRWEDESPHFIHSSVNQSTALILCSFFSLCWNLEHLLSLSHVLLAAYIWFSAAVQDLCLLSCTDRCVVIYRTQNYTIYCYQPGVWKFIDKQCYATFPAWFLFLCHIRKVGGTGACKHLKTISIVADGRPVALLLYTCLCVCFVWMGRPAHGSGRCEGLLENPPHLPFSPTRTASCVPAWSTLFSLFIRFYWLPVT